MRSENCSEKFGKRKEQKLRKANCRGKSKLCDLERIWNLEASDAEVIYATILEMLNNLFNFGMKKIMYLLDGMLA